MAENLPYSTSWGTLEKMLEKIKKASVPERFTQDFVHTKLSLKGGSANACIPILKKMGFVNSDGTPSDRYKEYRNPRKSRTALGEGFRKLYARLYEMNEYVHDVDDDELLGLIVECTGGEKDSAATKYTLATINTLRKHADFDVDEFNGDGEVDTDPVPPQLEEVRQDTINLPKQVENVPAGSSKSINLSYTINLNLPATKDIEVFNAIFKSLKQHILED
ncbi:DUF5343 domain-containing protein [uncultured Gilvimarinus sp.]|uniref:DUF5343 domain-containing protein n=1 Tax=uncultured Gilvimarinus sp. TaxID=1689143 RepID=UPI0030DC1D15